MKRASVAFGAMLALLLVVALSVPIGPPNAQGYSPTLLQFSLPFVIGIGVAILALVLIVRLMLATLKDRAEERQAWVEMSRQQSADYRYTFAQMAQVTATQAALVQQCINMGGMLAEGRNGQYYAYLPGGHQAPLDTVEADYWQEVAPERILPAGNTKGR